MKRFNLPLNGYLHMLQGSIRADKIFIQRLKISSNGCFFLVKLKGLDRTYINQRIKISSNA